MIVLVSGLINIETTLKVDRFPIDYAPVRYPFFGVNSTVSGVGYNVAKALTTLGEAVRLVSMIGTDAAGTLARTALTVDGIAGDHVLDLLDHTPQSVILYDDSGVRMINVDLKDVQDRAYPVEQFEGAIAGCSLAVLCNINFSRPFLAKSKAAGVTIATDVHTIGDLDDDYNRDFMAQADLLFMSDEHLPCSPEKWAQQAQDRYGNPIIVIGLGAAGALLAVKDDDFMERVAALKLRKVVNTIGAGDALFSAFVHSYSQDGDPYSAIKKATLFASYKIGEAGAAAGFLDRERLDRFYRAIYRS
jgi:ribokinase